MKLNRLFVGAAALLLPAAMASAYTLSIAPAPTLPAPPATGGSVTLTINLAQSNALLISGAATLVQVQKTDGTTPAPAGLTLTGGTGLGAGMIFAQYSDVDSGNLSTQSASSPNTFSRSRTLFVPVNGDGFPVAQTLTDGVLATVVLNYPAGLPAGTYPIKFIGTSGTDTFIADAQNNTILASSATGTTLTVLPEPASALLILGAFRSCVAAEPE